MGDLRNGFDEVRLVMMLIFFKLSSSSGILVSVHTPFRSVASSTFVRSSRRLVLKRTSFYRLIFCHLHVCFLGADGPIPSSSPDSTMKYSLLTGNELESSTCKADALTTELFRASDMLVDDPGSTPASSVDFIWRGWQSEEYWHRFISSPKVDSTDSLIDKHYLL